MLFDSIPRVFCVVCPLQGMSPSPAIHQDSGIPPSRMPPWACVALLPPLFPPGPAVDSIQALGQRLLQLLG